MKHPEPRYIEEIVVDSIEGVDFSNQERTIKAYEFIVDYIKNRTRHINSTIQEIEGALLYEQMTGITKDSVVIHSKVDAIAGKSGVRLIPKRRWNIELCSYQNPITTVRDELVQIITNAYRE